LPILSKQRGHCWLANPETPKKIQFNEDGMSGIFKSRKFTGVIGAILAGFFAAHEASGERAYLPVVGSPPLRFQAITTNHLVFNLDSFAQPPKKAAVSNAVTQIIAPVENTTNLVENSSPIPVSLETNRVPVKPETLADTRNNSVPPFNFANPSSTASDLLTVTPQMITEYLKPSQTETNRADQPGAVVFVPAELQFTPPAPNASAESRSIYKTQ
jgi:hypothetical protein